MPYAIPPSVLRAGGQVFCHLLDGRRVFVKKRRRNKNPLGWLAQRALHRFTGNLLILPPARPVGDNVRFESGMLRRMAEIGVPAPIVLHVERDYFVMSDAGRTLETALREEPGRADAYLADAVRALRRFHDKGFAHGGTQIKNLTVKDGKIHFIDFEENIPGERVDAFQLRDLFLFLLSLERHGHDPDLPAVCRLYDGGPGGGTLERMCASLRGLRVARFLDSRLFARFSMRDVRSLNGLIRKAEGAAGRNLAMPGFQDASV